MLSLATDVCGTGISILLKMERWAGGWGGKVVGGCRVGGGWRTEAVGWEEGGGRRLYGGRRVEDGGCTVGGGWRTEVVGWEEGGGRRL